jgi:DNA-binding response OmpR family regulator
MKKVLIIEDDQLVANIYRNKLAVDGFQVEVANNGETGLALVKSYRPDAVILDLILPKLSGVELMKLIRSEADFQTLPLIVFSNTYLSTLVQEAWKAGATKCLSKANRTPKQVIEVVRSVLNLGGDPVASKPQVFEPRAKLGFAPTDIAKAAATGFDSEMRTSLNGSFPTTLTALRNSIQALAKASTRRAA